METDAKTLQDWLENDLAVAVDVREKTEFEAGHINGANLIPIGTLNAEAVEKFLPRKIVCYCGGGGRGGRAAEKLRQENPEMEVYNLRGGFRGWKAANLPTQDFSAEEPVSFCSLNKKN